MDINKKAKKRDIPCKLAPEHIMNKWKRQRGACNITNKHMMHQSVHNSISPLLNTTIDRLDTSKPYTDENCHLVCAQVAQSKGDMNLDDYIDLCTAVVDHKNKKLTRRHSFP